MDLNAWTAKVRMARSQEELFAIVDDFRKGEWSDEQRSNIARLYIRLLENLPGGKNQTSDRQDKASSGIKNVTPEFQSVARDDKSADALDGDIEPESDAAVWYEKM
jgi:hypothetical protein